MTFNSFRSGFGFLKTAGDITPGSLINTLEEMFGTQFLLDVLIVPFRDPQEVDTWQ